MNDYPVGATWEADDGVTKVSIWFVKRDRSGREIWNWSSNMPNDYGWTHDWETSYRDCREHAPKVGVRFRRVK